MTFSNAIQTPVEGPSMDLCGVQIFAQRDGDRVTGRVVFPYPICGRGHVPIDYRSVRPDGSIEGGQPSKADMRAAKRLELVKRWKDLRQQNPSVTATVLGQRVAEKGGVSLRALQQWARKLEIEGPAGLRDHYFKPPKKVLTIDPACATDAVIVCAWWSFRIGNEDRIDTRMMAVAAGLIAGGYSAADLRATIDCYYAWSCDRLRYPFKPFKQWAKYDLEKWVLRACDENDYRRALDQARKERVPLTQPPDTLADKVSVPPVRSPRTRKRETLNRRVRSNIRKSAGQVNEPPKGHDQPSASDAVAQAKALRSFGLNGIARDTIADAAPGLSALRTNRNPLTIAETLGTLDDGYRVMLIQAAQGDREARDQAVATMPLWWDAMPLAVRNNIDFQVDHWRAEHPGTYDRQAALRKLDMLLPAIRNRRCGTQRLAVAARITA